MYYFVLAVLWCVRLHSPHRALTVGQCSKHSRQRAARHSVGIQGRRYKLTGLRAVGEFAGLAGSLKALVLGFATLSDVSRDSGEVILMTLLGAAGLFWGGGRRQCGRHAAGIFTDVVGAWVSVIMRHLRACA